MLKPKKQRSGRFDFEVDKKSKAVVCRGELEYAVKHEARPVSNVSVRINIHDEELNHVDSSTGVWMMHSIGPIEITLPFKDAKNLNESGTSQQLLLDKFVQEAMRGTDGSRFLDFAKVYSRSPTEFTSVRKKHGIERNPRPSILYRFEVLFRRLLDDPSQSYHSFMNQEDETGLDPQVKEDSRKKFKRIMLISVLMAILCIVLLNIHVFKFLNLIKPVLLTLMWVLFAIVWWANMEERSIDGIPNDDYGYSFIRHFKENFYKLGIYIFFVLVVSTGSGLQVGTSFGVLKIGIGS